MLIFTKMVSEKRKKIFEIIEVPNDVKAEIKNGIIKLSKDSLSLEKKLNYEPRIEGNKIIAEKENATKKDKKLIKTDMAHIRNLLRGLEKSYIYKLQICSVHFPISVNIVGNEVVIKNFLGETKERKAKILPNVSVKIEKDIIIVEGPDKENVGQTASNIEQATRIKKRDRRIFQDGIFIISKEKGAGKKWL